MTRKLACIILDALGPYNIRMLDFEYIYDLYTGDEYQSGLLCCSGLAHTPISNSMLWGGYHNTDKIWVENHPYRWTGGIDGFDPILQNEEGDITFWHREDLETNFVWDVLDHRGIEACALGIPICLPPYCYNAENRLESAWFPHTPEMLRHHVRRKPSFIMNHAVKGYDFIACSIKVPDQWLHAQGSGIVDDAFVSEEVPVLDELMAETIEVLEAEGYDWMIFGDHGSPIQGRTANFECRKMLARHRKEAAIIGSVADLPGYTDEMYPFILDYFGVEDVEGLLEWEQECPAPSQPRENVSMDTIHEIVKLRT